jgi:hypothetical protein
MQQKSMGGSSYVFPFMGRRYLWSFKVAKNDGSFWGTMSPVQCQKWQLELFFKRIRWRSTC